MPYDPLVQQVAAQKQRTSGNQDDDLMAALLAQLERPVERVELTPEQKRQQGLTLAMMIGGKGRGLGQAGEVGYQGISNERDRAQKAADQQAERQLTGAQFAYTDQQRRQQRADDQAWRQLTHADLQQQRAASNEIARMNAEMLNAQRAQTLGEKQRAEWGNAEKSVASTSNILSTIDQAINHPGRLAATGGTAWSQYIPLTDAREYSAIQDQIKGQAFLAAFETLKGGGQITEVEGKKATDAIARLNTSGLSEEAHLRALQDLREVVSQAQQRAIGQAQRAGVPGYERAQIAPGAQPGPTVEAAQQLQGAPSGPSPGMKYLQGG